MFRFITRKKCSISAGVLIVKFCYFLYATPTQLMIIVMSDRPDPNFSACHHASKTVGRTSDMHKFASMHYIAEYYSKRYSIWVDAQGPWMKVGPYSKSLFQT